MGVIAENLALQLGRTPGTVFFPGWERLCLASEFAGSWISLAGECHLPLAVLICQLSLTPVSLCLCFAQKHRSSGLGPVGRRIAIPSEFKDLGQMYEVSKTKKTLTTCIKPVAPDSLILFFLNIVPIICMNNLTIVVASLSF